MAKTKIPKKWTEEEKAWLQKWRLRKTNAQLAAHFGVTKGAISGVFYRLDHPDVYTHVVFRKPRPAALYVAYLRTMVDQEMNDAVMAKVTKDHTVSERLRDLIQWGLMAEEAADSVKAEGK